MRWHRHPGTKAQGISQETLAGRARMDNVAVGLHKDRGNWRPRFQVDRGLSGRRRSTRSERRPEAVLPRLPRDLKLPWQVVAELAAKVAAIFGDQAQIPLAVHSSAPVGRQQ